MADNLGSGLSFPLAFDSRARLALVSGDEDVEQAIRIILGTRPGEREMRPEFGCAVDEFIFERIDASTVSGLETEIRTALGRWEPRIDVQDIEFDLAGVDDGRLDIVITYRVRTTNSERNLVYPFYIIPAEERGA